MTLILSELIEKLEQQSQDNWVRFDFCDNVPDCFDSWRGIYAEIALGYKPLSRDNNNIRVHHLLTKAKEVIGNTYFGYKGGEFTMSSDTEVWVDNYGTCSNTALIDVIQYDHLTILVTQYQD